MSAMHPADEQTVALLEAVETGGVIGRHPELRDLERVGFVCAEVPRGGTEEDWTLTPTGVQVLARYRALL